ncbi:hypothetical protein AAMO2058_001387200 [Amorphochlora amoebiformis]
MKRSNDIKMIAREPKSTDLDNDMLIQLPQKLKKYIYSPVEEAKIPNLIQPGSCSSKIGWCCWFNPFCACYISSAHHLIKEGQIGLGWDGDEPLLFDKGRHFLLSFTMHFQSVAELTEERICHGPINIIRVAKGKIGYAMNTLDGQPMLLMAGTHVIRKSEFKFYNFLDLTKPVNNLGALKLIRVDQGEVGYYFQKGELEILNPGLHVVAPPDKFGNFLSTQLQLLSLDKQVHESGDYVRLQIDADVFYSVVNPKKALLRVKNLKNVIKKTAISTLAGIIRSSTLSEVAGSSRATFSNKDEKDGDSKHRDTAPSFQEKIHDNFLSELHEYMLKDLGIDISNIRINDLRIASEALAKNISKETIKIAEQEADYRMLQKEADIKTVRAENKALEKKIAAQATADEEMIRVKAQNQANIERARARAEAIEIEAIAESKAEVCKAEAKAKAILITAEAEKKARMEKGEGDKAYAKLIEETKTGTMLVELDTQASVLKGLQKVAYVPGLPTLLSKGSMEINPGNIFK